ncbi:rhodanese-like domain-containing protein [Ferrimonas balearica]|uniref:rhodanese-like domain-containing protein n=1 Tax=Ferrimonas balearica TaxID=44012 RepID=UPI001C99B44E|nr:rhodanese-like domain-containing protein [Ferrimonas balearica]MBY5992948.1 rhodanese-like domain-containing protein [Ferrimonas balearica]
MRYPLLALLLLSLSLPLWASERADIAWQWISQGALIVDVRTPEEFAEGHLPGAVNLPHGEIERRAGELGVGPEQTIVVYCRSGRRSGLAIGEFAAAGYLEVHNGGGLEEMREAHTP